MQAIGYGKGCTGWWLKYRPPVFNPNTASVGVTRCGRIASRCLRWWAATLHGPCRRAFVGNSCASCTVVSIQVVSSCLFLASVRSRCHLCASVDEVLAHWHESLLDVLGEDFRTSIFGMLCVSKVAMSAIYLLDPTCLEVASHMINIRRTYKLEVLGVLLCCLDTTGKIHLRRSPDCRCARNTH